MRKRARILIAVVVAVALIGIVVWLMRKEPAGASVAWPTAPSKLAALGHRYGHDADWKNAHECFKRVIAAGSANEDDYLWATGAAVAAGDTKACEELSRALLIIFGNDTDPHVAERCAKQVLALPNPPADLIEKAASRADYAAERMPNSGWKQLAKGMAEYRRGRWAEAKRWLEMAERAQSDIAVQAWPFGAMARHRLGDSTGARQALEEVNRRIDEMVRKGELCHPQYNTWDNVARAVAVRREAEQLIFGRVVSPAIDSAALIRNRKLSPGNDAR
jgi:tetratricopeptide (TPR) repeat protein